MQVRLVVFDRQNIVPFCFDAFLTDVALGQHGIPRYHATAQVEHRQQAWHGTDFIGFAPHFDLQQHDTVLRNIGGQQMRPLSFA